MGLTDIASPFVAPFGLASGANQQELLGGGTGQSQSTSSSRSSGINYGGSSGSSLGTSFGESLGGSTGSSFGQSTSGPWAQQQPYLQGLFAAAQDLYQNQSPYTQQYQQALAERAQSGSPLNTAAGQGLLETAQGAYLPGGSKYKDISTALLNQIRPSIDSMFAGGRFGSGLHKQGLASGLEDRLMSNYNQERQNQMAALGMLPQQAQQDYVDINQLAQAGQVPWQQAQQYQGLLGPAIQTAQSTSQAQNEAFNRAMNQAMNQAQNRAFNFGRNQATSESQSTGTTQQSGGLIPGLSGLFG